MYFDLLIHDLINPRLFDSHFDNFRNFQFKILATLTNNEN